MCDVLGNYFDYVPICPEIEVGMGVPRETVGLYGTFEITEPGSFKPAINKPLASYALAGSMTLIPGKWEKTTCKLWEC